MPYVWNNSIERKTPLKAKTLTKRVPGTARSERLVYEPGGGRVARTCKQCGKVFTAWRSAMGKACSDRCARLLRRTKVDRVCKTCGKDFRINPSQFTHYKGAGQFCSKPCANEGRIREKAVAPITDRYGRTRRQADRDWQQAVRERDNSIGPLTLKEPCPNACAEGYAKPRSPKE